MANKEEELSTSIMAIRYKIVFVGDICVGKTSIMNRFISDEFNEEYDVIIFFLNLFHFIKYIGNNRCRFCNKNDRIQR